LGLPLVNCILVGVGFFLFDSIRQMLTAYESYK
jgi:hypothetical protein